MKRILMAMIVLAAMFSGVSAYAQTEEQPHKVYCEIISTSRGMFSNKTTVELDFGQYSMPAGGPLTATWWTKTDRASILTPSWMP